jgi:hypothetical protein
MVKSEKRRGKLGLLDQKNAWVSIKLRLSSQNALRRFPSDYGQNPSIIL